MEGRVSDAHEGLQAAISKILNATWQCRVHFMPMPWRMREKWTSCRLGLCRHSLAQEDAASARSQWRQIAYQLKPKLPKLAALMHDAEADFLAYMTLPKEHRANLHSTTPLERVNGEIKRRAEVVGIFPNEGAIVRLVGVNVAMVSRLM